MELFCFLSNVTTLGLTRFNVALRLYSASRLALFSPATLLQTCTHRIVEFLRAFARRKFHPLFPTESPRRVLANEFFLFLSSSTKYTRPFSLSRGNCWPFSRLPQEYPMENGNCRGISSAFLSTRYSKDTHTHLRTDEVIPVKWLMSMYMRTHNTTSASCTVAISTLVRPAPCTSACHSPAYSLAFYRE